MNIISIKSLLKEFKIQQRETGFLGSLKALIKPTYHIKKALDHISFEVQEGELIGYIGPNGAGKSTTVKILSGILVPNGGEVKVFGKTPWEHRIETVKNLGVVFGQKTQLWWDLPVIESFDLLQNIYRLTPKDYRQSLDHLVDILQLTDLLSISVRQLSLGQRMRCDIAASLLHNPKILFLDEPTIGLDAVSKFAIRDFIRSLNKERKVTIILTTHDMDDIESLCKRVIILNQGRIFLDGSLETVRKKMASERCLIVDVLDENEKIHDSEATFISQEGPRITLSFNPAITNAPDLLKRITSKYAIRDCFLENPPIEKIIAKFYRDVNL